MSTRERRAEIIRVLRAKTRTRISYLAEYLNASERTIQRDLLVLTAEDHFPITTIQGNQGGVILTELHHPHRNIFTREQNETLMEMHETATPKQRAIIIELLKAFGKILSGGFDEH